MYARYRFLPLDPQILIQRNLASPSYMVLEEAEEDSESFPGLVFLSVSVHTPDAATTSTHHITETTTVSRNMLRLKRSPPALSRVNFKYQLLNTYLPNERVPYTPLTLSLLTWHLVCTHPYTS